MQRGKFVRYDAAASVDAKSYGVTYREALGTGG
jgi:hypothetical protein